MKTILYFKSTQYISGTRPSTKYVRINELARSFDDSIPERLYQISSPIYDSDVIEERYKNDFEFIDEDEAKDLGKLLQPDRELIDDITGEPYQFSFELPENESIKLAKVKMTDIKVPRGLEDLYEKLIEKGVLLASDIPTLHDQIAEKKLRRGKL